MQMSQQVQNVDYAHYANRNLLDITILKFGNHKQIRYMFLGIQDYDTRHICICRACHHDLTYNSTKPNYIPRFMKISNKCSIAQKKCSVTGCSNQADFKSTPETRSSDSELDVLLEGVMGRLQHSEPQSEGYAVLSTALTVGLALRKDTKVRHRTDI